jgi:hypothetical protein
MRRKTHRAGSGTREINVAGTREIKTWRRDAVSTLAVPREIAKRIA